jgi:hypothetical protein
MRGGRRRSDQDQSSLQGPNRFCDRGSDEQLAGCGLRVGPKIESRRIKKAQEEYPGMVHFLRIERIEDLDDDLANWLPEAFDYRKKKDEGDACGE